MHKNIFTMNSTGLNFCWWSRLQSLMLLEFYTWNIIKTKVFSIYSMSVCFLMHCSVAHCLLLSLSLSPLVHMCVHKCTCRWAVVQYLTTFWANLILPPMCEGREWFLLHGSIHTFHLVFIQYSLLDTVILLYFRLR